VYGVEEYDVVSVIKICCKGISFRQEAKTNKTAANKYDLTGFILFFYQNYEKILTAQKKPLFSGGLYKGKIKLIQSKSYRHVKLHPYRLTGLFPGIPCRHESDYPDSFFVATAADTS